MWQNTKLNLCFLNSIYNTGIWPEDFLEVIMYQWRKIQTLKAAYITDSAMGKAECIQNYIKWTTEDFY